jgi:hypothetical protein
MLSSFPTFFGIESANNAKKGLWWGELIKKRKQLDNTSSVTRPGRIINLEAYI